MIQDKGGRLAVKYGKIHSLGQSPSPTGCLPLSITVSIKEKSWEALNRNVKWNAVSPLFIAETHHIAYFPGAYPHPSRTPV
jgi:hypothetical protein